MINKVLNLYWYSTQEKEPPLFYENCIKSFEKRNPFLKIKFHKETYSYNKGKERVIKKNGLSYKDITHKDRIIAERKLYKIVKNNNEIGCHLDVFCMEKIDDMLLKSTFFCSRICSEQFESCLTRKTKIFYGIYNDDDIYNNIFLFRSYYYKFHNYKNIYEKYNKIRKIFYESELTLDTVNDIFKDYIYLFYNSPVLHFESGLDFNYGFFEQFLRNRKRRNI